MRSGILLLCSWLLIHSAEGLFGHNGPLVVNNTILCALQGGQCVTDVTTCSGKLMYKCDELSVGLCCLDSTNVHSGGYGGSVASSGRSYGGSVGAGAKAIGYGGHGYGHSSGHSSGHGYGQSLGLNIDYVNRTVLCEVTGGQCVTSTTSCVGKLKYQCQDLSAGLCCFNTSALTTAHLTSVHSGLGYGLKVHLNKTSLCTLRGGSCVTETSSCVGKLGFVCDNLSGGLCCFNSTSIHGYGSHGHGYGHGHGHFNKTVLCGLKGGTCTTDPTACVGSVAFNCENIALCCLNNTKPVSVHFHKFSYPRRKKLRMYHKPQQRGYGGGYGGYRKPSSKPQGYSFWRTFTNFWGSH